MIILFTILWVLVIISGYALYLNYTDMPSYNDPFEQIEDRADKSDVALLVFFCLAFLPILLWLV